MTNTTDKTERLADECVRRADWAFKSVSSERAGVLAARQVVSLLWGEMADRGEVDLSALRGELALRFGR